MFSSRTPRSFQSRPHAIAEAPAPENTTRTWSMRLPQIWRALSSAAPEMMAVPCWSSWKTGMSRVSIRVFSISKHSGARMSSRLMPPKVGAISWQTRITSAGSGESISMSKTSMSAKRLKRTPLPSMTGFEASAPMFPRPRTAVPFDTTATRLPFEV
jgi:hypothetical protein